VNQHPQRTPHSERAARTGPDAEPMLVLVTDNARLRGRLLADIVRAAVEGGVTAVQLRDKAASHDELLRTAALVQDAIAGEAQFIINSDVDAAIGLGADVVHLPEDGPATADVRARVGQSMRISRAVHSVEAAVRAEREGVDMVQAGTLFATASKPGALTLGVNGLRTICDAVRIPVIAIGGITPQNAADAVAAGAAGIAVIGAIFDAEDPANAARALRTAISVAAGVR
jgi:thiamine-phosphate diphosphorylase